MDWGTHYRARSLICVALLFWTTTTVFGQGTVQLSNFIPGQLDAPVLALDGVSHLSGNDGGWRYIIQLFAGSATNQLAPAGVAVSVGTGASAGYAATNTVVSIPGVAPGATAYCQLRVWNALSSPDYGIAVTNYLSFHAESLVIPVTTGPSNYTSIAQIPTLSGLKAFQLRTPGVVWVNNHIPGVVDAPALDLDGVTRLDGTNGGTFYGMELYAGPAPDQLHANLVFLSIGSGARAGYVLSTNYAATIPSVTSGEVAYCQLRVYDLNQAHSYEIAVAEGAAHAESAIVPVITGFTNTVPPNVTQQPPLIGLTAFQLHRSGPGQISFLNFVPGTLNAPVFDTDGSTPLAGAGYLAQLYYRAAFATNAPLTAVGSPVPFGVGPNAGYWSPLTNGAATLTLANVPAGQAAVVQVVVWEAAKGSTYEAAGRALGKRGTSALLQVTVGGDGAPPAVLTGLTAFKLNDPISGTVNFSNHVPGLVDAPVTYFDFSSIPAKPAPLAGSNYVAQLYAAPDYGGLTNQDNSGGDASANLAPMGIPVPFGTGAQAGYWLPAGDGTVAITNVEAGDYALVQVRIWDARASATYEQALSSGAYGVSSPIRLRTGGGGAPPALLTGLNPIQFGPSPNDAVIDFRNLIPGILDNPAIGPDGARLAGTNYLAQLYLAQDPFSDPSGQQGVPVGAPAPFGVGPAAGYWQPGLDSTRVIHVSSGCCAWVEVRVWDATFGATFETAGAGPRVISNRQTVSVGYQATLNQIGVISLQAHGFPTITLSDPSRANAVFDRTAPNLRAGFLAQVFVAVAVTNVPVAPGQPGYPTNFLAVGVPVPVDTTNVSFGIARFPTNAVIEISFLKPGQLAYARVRAWDGAKGATYAACVANGGEYGESSSDLSDNFAPYFTGNQLDQSPVPLAFSSYIFVAVTKTLTLPLGLSLISSPFLSTTATLDELLPNPPEGTTVYLFDNATQTYQVSSFSYFVGWWPRGSPGFNAGRAGFISIPSNAPVTLSFTGESAPPTPITARPSSPRFYLLGCSAEQPCQFPDLFSFPPIDGDTAYRWASGKWVISSYQFGAWSGSPPTINPGEALFFRLMPGP